MAAGERNVLFRKADQLMVLKFTKDEIDSFFSDGLLPSKIRGGIKTLDTAPNMTASVDFVDALKSHAREGTVKTLAVQLEPTVTDLADELLAELLLLQGKLPSDEPIMDEMATLVHREYGTSRKMGPVDHRALREMLKDRMLVRRHASFLQLQRALSVLEEERRQSSVRDVELHSQLSKLWDYLGEHRIRKTLLKISNPPQQYIVKPPPEDIVQPVRSSSRLSTRSDSDIGKAEKGEVENVFQSEPAHQDVGTLFEDAFSHIRSLISGIEHQRDEKRRLMRVLSETGQAADLNKEPPYSVIKRLLEEPRQEIKRQEFKQRALDERIRELQLQLAKVKRERPLKVTTKVESDQKLRERIEVLRERIRDLEDKECLLNKELASLSLHIGGSKRQLGFVARSRTVRMIRRNEREKARERLKMAAAVEAKMAAEADDGDRPPPHSARGLYSRLSRYGNSLSRSEGSLDSASRYAASDSDSDNEYHGPLSMSGSMTFRR